MWWLFAQKYVYSFQESQQGCTCVSEGKNSHLPCKTHNSCTFTGETIHHSLSIKMFKWWETVWQMAGDSKLLWLKIDGYSKKAAMGIRCWCKTQASDPSDKHEKNMMCEAVGRMQIVGHTSCQVCPAMKPSLQVWAALFWADQWVMCKKGVVGQV